MAGEKWTTIELASAVRHYLAMLDREKRGAPFSKAEVNRLLRSGELQNRSRSSVEMRMGNISHVMLSMGYERIEGYKPYKNVGSYVERELQELISDGLDRQRRIEQARGIVAAIFSLQGSLKGIAPQFNWRGLGNLLGDYGELVCCEAYGLSLAAPGEAGFDARRVDGKTIQIKTNRYSSTIGFRGDADLLLVIQVDSSGYWKELYYGDFELIKSISRYSARDNKFTIAVSNLESYGYD